MSDLSPGEHCQACGKEYFDVYSVPRPIWLLISPKKSDAGLLCPVCALERVCQLLAEVWRERDEAIRNHKQLMNTWVAGVVEKTALRAQIDEVTQRRKETVAMCEYLRAHLGRCVEALRYANSWFNEMANEGTWNATVDLRANIRDALDAQEGK